MNREEAIRYLNTDTSIEGFGDFPDMAKHTIECFIRSIYNDFESRTCKNCKFVLLIDNREELLCGNAKCEDINELGQYVVRPTFGCNEFKEKS